MLTASAETPAEIAAFEAAKPSTAALMAAYGEALLDAVRPTGNLLRIGDATAVIADLEHDLAQRAAFEAAKPDTEALMRVYAVHLMAAGRGPKIAARVAVIGAEMTAGHPTDAELLTEMDPAGCDPDLLGPDPDAVLGTLEEEFGPHNAGPAVELPEGIREANAAYLASIFQPAPLPAQPGTFLDGLEESKDHDMMGEGDALDDVDAFVASLPLPVRAARAPTVRRQRQAAAFQAVAAGEFPEHLTITSAANPSYQKRADKIREIADAGDLEALKAHPVNGSNTYAIRLRKYRDALVAALTARVAS